MSFSGVLPGMVGMVSKKPGSDAERSPRVMSRPGQKISTRFGGVGAGQRLGQERSAGMVPLQAAAGVVQGDACTKASLTWRPEIATDYEIGKVLGAGQQGVVCEARCLASDETFAVKLLAKDDIVKANPLALKRLHAEAVTMSELRDCENVAELVATYEDDEYVYVVMERLRGGSIADKISQGEAMDQSDVLVTMRGVFAFLEACHARGICYGDVKPANFMLTEDFDVKAIDFGCSQKVVPGLRLRHRVGSPLFMAPEVHLGGYGVEADMWSAGVMMYQVLSGRLPFVKMEGGEVVEVGLHLGFSFDGEEWADVSDEAKDVVQSLLVRDRNKRMSATQALSHALFKKMSRTSSSVVEFGGPSTADAEVPLS
ncbi:hypothetical protein BSKO_13227 [Bryopsis sp. KO-2023]|nr:hypothetical protein BSKO_13227 [Bryopsis sp. KO-2023]